MTPLGNCNVAFIQRQFGQGLGIKGAEACSFDSDNGQGQGYYSDKGQRQGYYCLSQEFFGLPASAGSGIVAVLGIFLLF